MTDARLKFLPEVQYAERREWERRNGIKRQPTRLARSSVYFLECDGFVKIGYATDLRARLIECAIGSPHHQRLLLSFLGGKEEERELHRRFSHLRHKGEWFRLDDELRRFIQEHPDNSNCKPM